MLSVGKHMRLSTGRMVANYLRRHVCPVADDAACPRLTELFNTSLWTQQDFLRELMQAPDSSTFFKSWHDSSVSSNSTDSPSDDAPLWDRAWVFCNQITGQCRDAITKEEWLEPSTRLTQCVHKITKGESNENAPIQFCLLDQERMNLCNKVVSWNLQITNILCRAAGICPESTFAYVPTMYHVANQEFASDTVQKFYEQLDDDVDPKCPASTVTDNALQQQIDSNNANRDQCASVQLEVVRYLIEVMRGGVGFIWRIAYYYMMMMSQFFQILIGATMPTGGAGLMDAGLARLLRYATLFLSEIGSAFNFLLEAVWKLLIEQPGSFGRAIKDIIDVMCIIINFIKRILCAIINKFVVPVLRGIAGAVGKIPLIGDAPSRAINTVADGLEAIADTVLCTPMQCLRAFDDAEESGDGTLPVPTRCWATYITFYGDTDRLSCSRADTCRAGSLNNDLVVCAQCEASGNLLEFGCDALTKLCTCNVPRYERTFCLSNEECTINPDATCAYLDSEFESSVGYTPCRTCQTEKICYLDRLTDQRFCACGLSELRFSGCNPTDIGQVITGHPDKLCLFHPDSRFAERNTFVTSSAELVTTACVDADITSLYCMRVVDKNRHMLVSTSLQNTFGRRLLGIDGQVSIPPNITRNALCRDALATDNLPEVRQDCLALLKSSQQTLWTLSLLNQTSDCAFCSMEDFWFELHNNTQVFAEMASNPGHVLFILSRHGPTRYVRTTFRAAVQVLEVLAHSMTADTAYFNSTSSAIQSAWDWLSPRTVNVTVTNTSHKHSQPHGRKLTGMNDLIQQVDQNIVQEFETVQEIHEQYSTQLGDVFDYPNLANAATSAWNENWPPQFETPEGTTCQALFDTMQVFKRTADATVLAYTSEGRAMRATPATHLHEAWPKLKNYTLPVEEPQTASDIIGQWFISALTWLLDNVGLSTQSVYNLFNSVADELQIAIKCDIEAVQTCSKWNVRLIHSLIICGIYFSIWILLLNSIRLPFVVVLTTPLFTVFVLYLAYGYSPFCFPLIPVCFIDDLHQTLRMIFPKVMTLPSSLVKPNCNVNVLYPQLNCTRACSDEPFELDSWYATLGWFVGEFGDPATDAVIDNIDWVPLLDHKTIKNTMRRKRAILKSGDDSLITGHRICATLNSWRLAPYLVILLLVTSCLVVVASIIPLALNPIIQIVVQLYVSFFTQ